MDAIEYKTPSLGNVAHGVKVISRDIFKHIGAKGCTVGEVVDFVIDAEGGAITGIDVRWSHKVSNKVSKRYKPIVIVRRYHPDELFVLVKNRHNLDNNNPNATFTKGE